jgi:hypothetical protein
MWLCTAAASRPVAVMQIVAEPEFRAAAQQQQSATSGSDGESIVLISSSGNGPAHMPAAFDEAALERELDAHTAWYASAAAAAAGGASASVDYDHDHDGVPAVETIDLEAAGVVRHHL